MQILNRTKRIIKSTVIGGSAAAVLVASPVAFAHGSSHSGDDDHNRSSRGSSHHVASADHRRNDDFKRKHHQQMQKTCAEQQAAANRQADSAKTRDTKKLNGLNIILSGTQSYATSGDVTVENYDTLNATATTSQTNATNAVNAIVAPTLNCDDDSAADANKVALSDFNNQVKTADKSLATYRHDVFTLFNATIES